MPDPWTIYGIRLRPFSLGHWLLLDRVKSRVISGGLISPSDLATCLWICSNKASDLIENFGSGMKLSWRLKAKRIVVGAILSHATFISRRALFFAYLEEACKPPNHYPIQGEKTKEITAPFVINIMRALKSSGYTRSEALNAPMKQARFEHLAALEEVTRGKLSFVTDSDMALAEGV